MTSSHEPDAKLLDYHAWRNSFVGTKRNTIISADGNCEGYIQLEDENGFLRSFFFVLDIKEMKFKCYSDNPKKCPTAVTTVKNLVDIRYVSKISKVTKPKKNFSFEISTPSQKNLLVAKDESEMNYWITAITKAAVNPTPLEYVPIMRSTSVNAILDSPDQEQSFQTSIIGGVVVKTPVSNPSHRSGSESLDSHTASKNKKNNSSHKKGLKVMIEGWCWKQGAVMKNWKRRYFRLNTILLSYYENDKVDDPIRSIATHSIRNVRILPKFCSRDNMIEVETPNRKFYMHVDDSHEPNAWKEALEKIMIQNGKYLPRTKSV